VTLPEHVQWSDVPPEGASDFVPIYSAKCAATFELVSLGGELVGVWTHYWRERTIPCVAGSSRGCICEREELPRRWKGYLCAWEPRYSRRVLIELSADALHNANFALTDVAQLRGRFLRLSRRGKSRFAPIVIEATQATVEVEGLPAPFCIKTALARVWSGQARD